MNYYKVTDKNDTPTPTISPTPVFVTVIEDPTKRFRYKWVVRTLNLLSNDWQETDELTWDVFVHRTQNEQGYMSYKIEEITEEDFFLEMI